MVICKICKKEMASLHIHPAGRKIAPNCMCGKIRKREREKGCPKCGYESGPYGINAKKHWFFWILRCDCGMKWGVRS